MAKRKKINKGSNLVRKCIALLSSIIVFSFLFMEMISSKTEYFNVLKNQREIESVDLKFSDFLFSEKYEALRETFNMTTTIMWIVFALIVLSMILTSAAFLLKKGALASKIGVGVLIFSLLLMLSINLYKVESILNVTTWYSNLTGLYFAALACSCVGMICVITLKD